MFRHDDDIKHFNRLAATLGVAAIVPAVVTILAVLPKTGVPEHWVFPGVLAFVMLAIPATGAWHEAGEIKRRGY